jgi:hypothetical protein
MTIAEIIDALTPYTGGFPTQAIREAIAQREAITPELLRILKEVGESPEAFARNDYMLHLFATYLLAQFRDKRAYPLLTKILSAPGEVADNLYGQTLTESMKSILGSVYDGDPEPLRRLVEGEEVNEWMRGAAVQSFLVLAHTGQMARAEVSSYFQSLFRGKLIRNNEQVWNDLACAVADLPAPELVEDLRLAYDEGLIDPDVANMAELERDARTPYEQKPAWKRETFRLMGDAVSEMEWWVAFRADEEPEVPEPPMWPRTANPQPAVASVPLENQNSLNVESSPAASDPLRREPKIGRNEACPCGSGKKYKKCCLQKAQV